MGRKHQPRKMQGCYKAKGYSHTDWDGMDTRPTRPRLKREDNILLSDALYGDLEPENLPGAFGEGGRQPRRTRREDPKVRREKWERKFKKWIATLEQLRRGNTPL